MIDLDALEAKARAATPGPWIEWCWDDSRWNTDYGVAHDDRAREIANTGEEAANGIANAAYIAALAPELALALIARIRGLEAALAPFADYITEHPRGPASDAIGYDTWLNAMRHSVSWTEFERASTALREAARVSKEAADAN